MDDFGSEFYIKVDLLSFFLGPQESNEKHSLRSSDKADNRDDVENYLYADEDKVFENFFPTLYSSGNLMLAIVLDHIFQLQPSDDTFKTDFDKLFWF